MRVCLLFLLLPVLVACGGNDEMRLLNRLNTDVHIDLLAPRTDLTGGCDIEFRRRFCAEEYEPIGVIKVSAGEDRFLTVSDPVTADRCTNVLWLRLLWLGETGPVEEPGTTFQLPVVAEVETEAGRFHGVAFNAATVRIDEVGTADEHQDFAPVTCASLGRGSR